MNKEGKRKTSVLILYFPLSFFPCQSPSSSPSAPGGLCLDRIEFSRANMGKALSRLCMVNVSVERVISPALPSTPTYSLARGSQSADLCCWGDLVFHVGYLKSANTSLSLFLSFPLATFSLSRALALYNHITYPSPIPLYCSLHSLPPSPSFQCLFCCSLLPCHLLLHLFPLLCLSVSPVLLFHNIHWWGLWIIWSARLKARFTLLCRMAVWIELCSV